MKYEISDIELDLIIKACTHSANLYVTFYEQNSSEYPFEIVKPYRDNLVEIITNLKTQKYINDCRCK